MDGQAALQFAAIDICCIIVKYDRGVNGAVVKIVCNERHLGVYIIHTTLFIDTCATHGWVCGPGIQLVCIHGLP